MQPGCQAGGDAAHSVQIEDAELANSPIITGNNNRVDYVTKYVSLTDHIAEIVGRPDEIAATMAKIGRLLNAGDPNFGYRITVDERGAAVEVEPLSPDAIVRANVRIPVVDGKTMEVYLRQAMETQESVTIDNAGMRLYHDDRLAAERSGVTLTISQRPVGPTVRGALIVPETGARLDDIELQGFPLPNGWLRLTNARQDNALVVLSFDLDPRRADAGDRPDDASHPAFSFHLAERHIRGYNLRHKLAVDDFLRSLQQPRLLQIYNYATWAPEADIYLDSTVEPDSVRDRLMDALRTIQDTFPDLTFYMPESLTEEDFRLVMELEAIITTGEQSESLERARVALISHATQHLPDNGVLPHAMLVEESIFTLWGTRMELGTVRTILPPLRIVQDVLAIKACAAGLSDEDIIPADLVPADPGSARIIRRYERFWRESQT